MPLNYRCKVMKGSVSVLNAVLHCCYYTEVLAISLATGGGERQASGRHIGLAQQRRLGARKPEGAPALAMFIGPVRYI